jgi:hypothetical protein
MVKKNNCACTQRLYALIMLPEKKTNVFLLIKIWLQKCLIYRVFQNYAGKNLLLRPLHCVISTGFRKLELNISSEDSKTAWKVKLIYTVKAVKAFQNYLIFDFIYCCF